MIEQQSDQAPWTIQQTFLGIFVTLVPWVVFAIGLNSFGGERPARTTRLPPQADLTNAIIIFFIASLIEAAFLIAPLYFANRAYRTFLANPFYRPPSAWRALGFKGFPIGRTLAWIFILVLAILAVDNLYQYVITVFHLHLQTNDQVILERSKTAPLSTYATLLVAVFVAPFCEEVFFRGFVFPGLCRSMPVGWAIILSALLFGVAHADPGSFAVLFIIGLVLAFLRWRTNSLWPGIVLHDLNNGLGALVIILVMNGVLKQ